MSGHPSTAITERCGHDWMPWPGDAVTCVNCDEWRFVRRRPTQASSGRSEP